MKFTFFASSYFRSLVFSMGCGILGACSIAPGQYFGVLPSVNETDQEYVYDAADSVPVEQRVNIFPITAKSVAELHNRRVAIERERVKLRQSIVEEVRSKEPYVYKIAPNDVLRITVWNHPELNNPSGVLNDMQGRVVNSDGYFFYPYAGEIRAASRTVNEVRQELTQKLSAYLVEPQVDVAVLTYRGKRAFVLGQVEKPGIVPITDVPLTITDLISQAGGLRPEANLREATLMRKGRSVPIDLYALYYEGDVSQNIPLEHDDILTINENRVNKVFILGEVGKPQSMVMPRGRLSLAEAVADAGGFNPLSANAGQVYVIREGQAGKPEVWHLNAAAPDALVLADRFDLQARDIVYVDPANVARFGRVVSNIVPTANVIRAAAQN